MPQILTGCSPALFGLGTENGRRICLADGTFIVAEARETRDCWFRDKPENVVDSLTKTNLEPNRK